MTTKICELCGGLVASKNGKEPPRTQFGCVRCWACYDDKSERVEPPAQRYEPGARCKTCGTELPPDRRCGRCRKCQDKHRQQIRRGYMQRYMRDYRNGGPRQAVVC